MQSRIQSEPVERACPICGGSGGAHVDSATHDVCGIGRVSFDIRCCDGCGLVLQDPVTSPDAIEAQYALFSSYAFSVPMHPPASPPTQRIVDVLSSAGTSPGQVYDVGAATGGLLYHLRRAGWEVAGCDPSPTAVRVARETYGIELEVGDESELLPKKSGVDLFTFSHVLEHLYDPVETLKRCHGALSDWGHVAFEVPCFVDPDTMGPAMWNMEHLQHFTEGTSTRMLAEAGFAPVISIVSFWERHYPVVTVLARKTSASTPASAGGEYERAVRVCEAYIRREAKLWESVEARLRERIPDGAGLVVWGAGLHTARLLERTSLSRRAKILGVLVRDQQKLGQKLGPYEVISDSVLAEQAILVVISSYSSESAIRQSLLQRGLSAENIVSLYDMAD